MKAAAVVFAVAFASASAALAGQAPTTERHGNIIFINAGVLAKSPHLVQPENLSADEQVALCFRMYPEAEAAHVCDDIGAEVSQMEFDRQLAAVPDSPETLRIPNAVAVKQ